MTPEAAKETLLARRAELLGHIERIEDQLDDPMPKDWEDAASERQGDEVLTALGHSDRAEIRRIDAALARIEAGEYGDCVKCGNPIAEKRLQLLPDTPFCANCSP
ncbi:TraR/DksA family transcriptional regulator [Paracoccus sp. MC1854]|uniref:TraR/DksA family transcriptional regulator n=1 Tax=Paracoccus sp. MC1854 TaxID=2760306 RepID=UPI00160460B0|nr:TraR/DksA C4-type zinc finger protein [Paracoccus sp. MC1854]MBB1492886.1 TraR/DksA family transcriptional regulator [Paracoccus sp. MC1854]